MRRDVMRYKKIFIMTLPRSGSTLLGQQLGINSQIFHLGESMYWEILDPKDSPCSCGKINCRFLGKVSKNIREGHLALPLLKAWQIIDRKYWPEKKVSFDGIALQKRKKIEGGSFKHWLSLCPTALEKIIRIYQKHSPKRVFIDNTKLFNIWERLASNNDWGIIILLRDPRGIMSSYKNAGVRKKDGRAAESVLPFCRDFICAAKKLRNLRNVHIVKYEDFCNDHVTTLQAICTFIGVQFEKKMANPFNNKKATKGHVLKGNRMLWLKKTNRPLLDDTWKSNLNANELHKLYAQKLIVKLYRSFGYSLS